MSQSTQLPCRRRTLDFLFHCKGRPGVILGSPQEQFIHSAQLSAYEPYAPLLPVDVTRHSCLVPPLTLLGLEPMLQSAAQMESICKGLGSSRAATPVVEWNAALCPGLMFCAAMLSVYWSCLFHDEHWRYVSVKGRPGVILGSPCSFR